MELCGTEEEETSGYDTHTILVSLVNSLDSLGLHIGFDDNKWKKCEIKIQISEINLSPKHIFIEKVTN